MRVARSVKKPEAMRLLLRVLGRVRLSCRALSPYETGDSRGPTRLASLVGLLAVIAAVAPVAASAQAPGQQPGQAAPPPPPEPIPVPKKPPPTPAPLHWWCEVNALPASDSAMAPSEQARNFFMSQVIERPHTVDPDELHTVTRICRTAFEVQFGGQWRLVTARAQQAATEEAARLGRLEDIRIGNHEGHEQDFRIPN
jgi:hypothetical protein